MSSGCWGLKSRDPWTPEALGPQDALRPAPSIHRFSLSLTGTSCGLSLAAASRAATLYASPARPDPLQESTAPRLVPEAPPPRGLAFVPWAWMGWAGWLRSLDCPAVRAGWGPGAGLWRNKGLIRAWMPPTIGYLKPTPQAPPGSGSGSFIVRCGRRFPGWSPYSPSLTFSSSIGLRTPRGHEVSNLRAPDGREGHA